MSKATLIAHTVLTGAPTAYRWQQAFTPCSDELAEMAGRLCYLSWARPNPATAANADYLGNIIAQGHFSVMEHASAAFYIEDVTRNFTHELIRHRHLGFSEVSQRYVDLDTFKLAQHPGIPDGWMHLLNQDSMPEVKTYYRRLVDHLTQVKGLKRKQARQAARHIMPGGLETKIIASGNMRAWRDVLRQRLARNEETGEYYADAEFVQVALQILQQLKSIAPGCFQDFPDVDTW